MPIGKLAYLVHPGDARGLRGPAWALVTACDEVRRSQTVRVVAQLALNGATSGFRPE